jgi:hypothetical protein
MQEAAGPGRGLGPTAEGKAPAPPEERQQSQQQRRGTSAASACSAASAATPGSAQAAQQQGDSGGRPRKLPPAPKPAWDDAWWRPSPGSSSAYQTATGARSKGPAATHLAAAAAGATPRCVKAATRPEAECRLEPGRRGTHPRPAAAHAGGRCTGGQPTASRQRQLQSEAWWAGEALPAAPPAVDGLAPAVPAAAPASACEAATPQLAWVACGTARKQPRRPSLRRERAQSAAMTRPPLAERTLPDLLDMAAAWSLGPKDSELLLDWGSGGSGSCSSRGESSGGSSSRGSSRSAWRTERGSARDAVGCGGVTPGAQLAAAAQGHP